MATQSPPVPARLAPELLHARCAGIELLVMDVDGVLTDGGIVLDDHGVESKQFHVRDGWAIARWRKLGRRAAILSGRRAAVVERRAAELGISPVVQGAAEKSQPFRSMLQSLGLEPRQVAYIGDDLPDLPLLRVEGLGLAACPGDAVTEVQAEVHYCCQAPGGRGAVRELIEVLLKAQGLWDATVAECRRPA